MTEQQEQKLIEEIKNIAKQIITVCENSGEKELVISALPIVMTHLIKKAAQETSANTDVVAKLMFTFIIEATCEHLKRSIPSGTRH